MILLWRTGALLMIGLLSFAALDARADSILAPPATAAVGGGAAEGDEIVSISASLQRIAQEVVKRNATVFSEFLQAQMAKEQITAEKGIFEPVFQTSFTQQKIHVPNSAYDQLISRQFEYFERSDALDMEMTSIVPTGAKLDLKFTGNKKNSSIIEQYRDYLYEYSNSLKFTLEQPLLRGFGTDATMVKINLAKVQSDIGDSKFEQKLMELVGVTVQVYWRLYGAQKIAQSWETSLKIAQESLKDIELRAASGRIAHTEVLEAQSLINARRAELFNAKSKAVEAQNQLMTLLNVSASDNRAVYLMPADNPFRGYIAVLNPDEYVRMALEKWPEYNIAKKNVEKEKIQVKNARDQLLPKLDLVGSVSTNSLTSDRDSAFSEVSDDRFMSWSIGLKLSIPILGNMQAKSGLTIAQMRARQAESELKSLVASLNNSIDSKVSELKSFQEQLLEYEKGLKVREQLLEMERVKFKLGRTNLKTLFSKEEEYINYQRRVYSAVVNYKVAEASLEIAAGNILTRYDIDRKSVSHQTGNSPGDLKNILE